MLNFTFVQSVKIITGIDSLNSVGELVEQSGYKKPLLVFGNQVNRMGIIKRITDILDGRSINYVKFNKVIPDPPATTIDEGGEICKKHNCDCVIGIGGGSAIDTAKGINILRFNKGKILDYTTKTINLCTGLICIPTTSGTGSELSNGAIISDTQTNTKLPILCFNNMCEYAILDPTLTVGMPYDLTMYTGLDVFSHCFEAYTSILSNPMTDLICEKLMETIIEYLPITLNEPSNIIAREKMQYASSIGGWMLYNACAHVGHSIAHVIGANLHIIHGAACAYGLPSVIKLISEVSNTKVKYVGKLLGVKFVGNETSKEVGEKTAKAYKEFTDYIKLPDIKKYDLSKQEFDKLVDMVKDEMFAGFAPIKITKENVNIMLKEVLQL